MVKSSKKRKGAAQHCRYRLLEKDILYECSLKDNHTSGHKWKMPKV